MATIRSNLGHLHLQAEGERYVEEVQSKQNDRRTSDHEDEAGLGFD